MNNNLLKKNIYINLICVWRIFLYSEQTLYILSPLKKNVTDMPLNLYIIHVVYFSVKCLLSSVRWLKPCMFEDEMNSRTKSKIVVLIFTNVRSLFFFNSESSNAKTASSRFRGFSSFQYIFKTVGLLLLD